jgi:tetratricopeptide (TPR) repeat protein
MTAAPEFSEALDAFRRGDLGRARAIAERELQSSPSSVGEHLLGLIHCRLGDPLKGVEHLRSALEAEPDNLQFRVMLARALIDCRRPEEALAVAVPAAGTSAGELALWHARAEAADAAGRSEESIEAWERLCRAGVSDWRIWRSYGGALAAGQRWQEAAAAFRRAIALNPGEAPLRRVLATALARAGRHDESADELRRWVEAEPGDPTSRVLLARLLADLGRNEECLAELDAALLHSTGRTFGGDGGRLLEIALASGEVDVPLLRELAHLLERISALHALRSLLDEAEARGVARDQLGYPAAAIALKDGDAKEAKRLLLADSPESDPVRWHWLMARIADALGETDTAFAEADLMNRSAPDHDSWRKRSAAHLHWVRELAGLVTEDWAKRIAVPGPTRRPSPVFLVGFPRSGTTLLDTFLMGHPDAAVLEEVPLVHAIEAVLGNIAELPDRSPEQLERAREAYFDELDRHVDPAFTGLIIDKLPLNLVAVPLLHAVFPDARFIFAQRHPCDCVLSCFMQGFALNASMACFLDINDAASYYDAVMSVWTHSRETLPLDVHTMVYEEMVADPEAALRPLVCFLGLDWSDELLDHRRTAIRRGAISTPSYDQVVQPVTTRASGRWRRYEKQLEPVLPVLLPWARRLGYS